MQSNMEVPVTIGFSNADGWVRNPDNTVQVVTSATGDETVVFTNVPYSDDFGVFPWVDTSNSTTPNTEAPAYKNIVIGSPSNGRCTITVNITTVTSAQNGCKWKLRLVK